jgi:hypothetical protein
MAAFFNKSSSYKVEYNINRQQLVCVPGKHFFLYSKKDFRKTFIKEIVQKFANSRQKAQIKHKFLLCWKTK